MTVLAHVAVPASRWMRLPSIAAELDLDPVKLRFLVWSREVEFRESSPGDYEIDVFSLPEEQRERLLALHPDLAPPEKTSSTEPSRYVRTRLASVRNRADERLDALLSFRAARAARLPNETLAAVESQWLVHYRRTHPAAKASLRSVKEWDKAFTQHGIDGLVDGNDGSKRLGSTIPDEAKQLLHDLYLQKQSPNLRRVYKRVKERAEASGWTPVPSYQAFYNYAQSVPKMARALTRECADRPRDVLPFVRRDPTTVPVYHTLQGDHRLLDVPVSCGNRKCRMCYVGGTRKPGHRAWWTVWIDTRSRYIVYHELSLDAGSTERTLRGVGRTVLEYGVPVRWYVDNGADFIMAFGDHMPINAAGVKKAGNKPVRLPARLAALGTDVMYALPGNPPGKAIVERALGVFRRAFDEQFTTMVRDCKLALHDRDTLPKVSEIAYQLQVAVDIYHRTPHGGLGMDGRTPLDVFNDPSIRAPRRDADPMTFATLFFEARGARVIGRLGVQYEGRMYRLSSLEKLFEYFGTRVDIRVWPDDPRRVALFDRKTGALICDAHLDELLATYDTRDEITKWLIARTFRDIYKLRRMAARAVGGDLQARLAEHARVMMEYYENLIASPADGPREVPDRQAETLTFLSRLDSFASDPAFERDLSEEDWQWLSKTNYYARARHLDQDGPLLAASPEDTEDDAVTRAEVVRLDRGLCELCSDAVGRSRILCPKHEAERGVDNHQPEKPEETNPIINP